MNVTIGIEGRFIGFERDRHGGRIAHVGLDFESGFCRCW